VAPIDNTLVIAVKDLNGLTKETNLMEVRYATLINPTEEEMEESEKKSNSSNCKFVY